MSDQDPKPVTQRAAYLEALEAQAVGDHANGTLQERDSQASQAAEAAKKVVEEKTGTGRDNTDENKRVILSQMAARAAAAEKAGNKQKAAEIRARMKEVENQ